MTPIAKSNYQKIYNHLSKKSNDYIFFDNQDNQKPSCNGHSRPVKPSTSTTYSQLARTILYIDFYFILLC
jgi:uncharacterized membrane-anchored protein YhcB (DUF1043 family)